MYRTRWRVELVTSVGVLSSSMDEQGLNAVTEGARHAFGEDDFVSALGTGIGDAGQGRMEIKVEISASSPGVAAAVAVDRVQTVLVEEYRAENISIPDARVERLTVMPAPVGDEWSVEPDGEPEG